MRPIKKIVVHCSDSDLEAHDSPEIIRIWHLERGWDDIGYHFVITKNGALWPGRLIRQIGAHVKNHNKTTIGICLTGRSSFSLKQMETLQKTLWNLLDVFGLTIQDVVGHYELDHLKTCPNIDMDTIRSKLWNSNQLT